MLAGILPFSYNLCILEWNNIYLGAPFNSIPSTFDDMYTNQQFRYIYILRQFYLLFPFHL